MMPGIIARNEPCLLVQMYGVGQLSVGVEEQHLRSKIASACDSGSEQPAPNTLPAHGLVYRHFCEFIRCFIDRNQRADANDFLHAAGDQDMPSRCKNRSCWVVQYAPVIILDDEEGFEPFEIEPGKRLGITGLSKRGNRNLFRYHGLTPPLSYRRVSRYGGTNGLP